MNNLYSKNQLLGIGLTLIQFEMASSDHLAAEPQIEQLSKQGTATTESHSCAQKILPKV